MKTILAILIFAAAAAGQTFIPCLENVADPGVNDSVWFPGMAASLPVHTPKWETRQTADSAVYKIAPGSWYAVPLSMPAAGRCVGSFASENDNDEAAEIIINAAGNYIPNKPGGEVEVLLVNPDNFARFRVNRNFIAAWSSGRAVRGSFDLNLPGGLYYLIINNRFASITAKSVRLTLGPADTLRP